MRAVGKEKRADVWEYHGKKKKKLSSFSVPPRQKQRSRECNRWAKRFIQHAEHRTALSVFSQTLTKRCVRDHLPAAASLDRGEVNGRKVTFKKHCTVKKHTYKLTNTNPAVRKVPY